MKGSSVVRAAAAAVHTAGFDSGAWGPTNVEVDALTGCR